MSKVTVVYWSMTNNTGIGKELASAADEAIRVLRFLPLPSDPEV